MTEDPELELVERLAEEFTARIRRGERPTIKEYAEHHPHLAQIIRDTFQALALMEDLAPGNDDSLAESSMGNKPSTGAARPECLGDYRIIREVGRGGMGIVYEAEQVSLGRHVAVKVLPKELLQNPKHRSRFEREAKAAAKLHHTNIVPVFGVGEENGAVYYVMQFIQGLALDEVLDELKRMDPRPGTSGGEAEFGQARIRDRDVSAADLAKSLMEGAFPPITKEPQIASDERGLLDETMAHGPLRAVEQPPSIAAADVARSPLDVKPPTSSKSTVGARFSETFSVARPPDALSSSSSGTHKKNRKPTYWQRVAHIGVQVAEALHYAHGQGILHRDIKPSNLLLDLRGTVWVTDFGLAKLDDDRGLTQTGDILGTLRYLAPESLKRPADVRSEVYTLGLTLYELLALGPAIEPTHRHAILDQVLNGQIESLSKRNAEIPRDLVTIVHKAIERDPRHRYPTAQELADDLRRFIDDEPIQARRLSTFEHVIRWGRHNRGLAASLAAVTTLVCVLAIGSTIAAGYFRSVSGELSNTVHSLQATQGELHEKVEALNQATGEAQEKAAENLELAKVAQNNLRKAEVAERESRRGEEEGRRLLYTTDMRLAPFVWKDGGSTAEQLRSLLARHEPKVVPALSDGESPSLSVVPTKEDLRGFEWHYYKHLLENSARVFRHDAPVMRAGLTSDGQLVTLDQNAQIRRWDLETRKEDQSARIDAVGGRSFEMAAMSPNGRLAALRVGAKLRLIDTATGDTRLEIDGAQGISKAAAFSRDGRLLVVIGDDIRWCDTENGTVVGALDERTDGLRSFGLSADGLTVVVSGRDTVGMLFSVYRLDTAGKKVAPLANDGNNHSTIGESVVSADGTLVAIGAKFNASVMVCDALSGTQIAWKGHAHPSSIAAMAFSPDASELATSDLQGTIKLWGDPRHLNQKSEPKRIFKGHSGAITSLCFSSDGKLLVSTSADKTARVWQTHESESAVRRVASTHFCYSARFSPDGLLVAFADGHRIRLCDAATGQVTGELFAGNAGLVSSVAFSPDNRLLAAGHGDTKHMSHVSLWEIDTGKQLASLQGASDLAEIPVQWDFGSVTAVDFSPDGKNLVACFGALDYYSTQRFSCPLKVWDVATGQLIRRLEGHQGLVSSLAFSPDGSMLASGGQDGTAIVWSTSDWKAVRALACPEDESAVGFPITDHISDLAFSPDGRTLAMANSGGSVVLYEAATGQPQATLKGHSSKVCALAFSPDGRTLASGGEDNIFRLWNLGTRRELVVLDSGNIDSWPPRNLAFSPDGSQLLASGASPRIWSASPSLWDEPERAAEKLHLLLQSNADFQSRLWMLSKAPRLGEALEKLEKLVPGGVQVQVARATTRARQLAKLGNRTRAGALFKEVLAKDPENAASAAGLAELLLDKQENDNDTRWTVLKPAEAKSEPGATLSVLADQSILASGIDPPNDRYRVVSPVMTDIDLAAVRLEALVHASLPGNGPGRYPGRNGHQHRGTFNLVSLRVTATSPDRKDPIAFEFDNASADADTIFPISKEGWNIAGGGEGRNCTAIWSLSKPAHLVTGTILTFEMQFGVYTGPENLGHFRVSVSGDAGAIDRTQKRLMATKITDPWAKLAAAYRFIGDQTALERLAEHHPAFAASVGDLYADKQDWQRAIAEYSKIITRQNADADVLAKRAKAYEATERWDEARADWRRAIEQRPDLAHAAFDSFRQAERWSGAAEFGLMLAEQKPEDSLAWLQIAPVLVLAGDDADYPAYCRRIVEQFAEPKSVDVPDKVVKACLLRPDAIELAKLPVDRFAASLDEGAAPEWYLVWAWGTRGLLAYRGGDAESAVKYVAKSEELKPGDFTHALNLVVLAMAEHRLQHPEDARRALEEAVQLTDRLRNYAGNKDNHDLLMAQILLHEGQALISGKAQSRPNGQETDATGDKAPRM